MGLFKGAVSYRRYRLLGEVPEDHVDRFLSAATKRVFKPIEGKTDEERSCGWVSIHSALDTELGAGKVFFDDLVLFRLRVDEKKVPGPVLAAHVQKAEREHAEKNNRENLTRGERRNIREMVRLELLGRVVPAMRTFDVAVDLAEREVRFWSLARAVCEEFQELFENTFGLNLLPLGPWGLSSKLLPPLDLDRMDALNPSIFARPRA